MGGGGQGVSISRFPYLVLLVPAPFLSGSCLCVLYLLQNIVQCCIIHFLFPPIHAPLGIPSPALSSPTSRTLPVPITPRFPRPCPPPLICGPPTLNIIPQHWFCFVNSPRDCQIPPSPILGGIKDTKALSAVTICNTIKICMHADLHDHVRCVHLRVLLHRFPKSLFPLEY